MADFETPNIRPKIDGVFERIPDRNRIHLPIEWKEILGPNTWVIILNTGNYLIIIPEKDFSYTDPDLITVREQIHEDGRLLISKNIQDTFDLKTEGFAGLIGKSNHAELYLNKRAYDAARERSKQAASMFQAKLLGLLDNGNNSQ